MELRPHQISGVEKLRFSIAGGKRRPILFAPCSFGKTICAAYVAKCAEDKCNKTLFLVHRRLLAEQTKEKFDQFGLKSSIIMAGYETDFSVNIMITTHQTYSRRIMLDDPEVNKFFHDAACLIVDECFVGNTSVSGRKIEEIQVGDTVDSFNHFSGLIEKKKVIGKIKRKSQRLVKVKFVDGSICKCTENHEFYVDGIGYLPSIMLCANMHVIKITKEICHDKICLLQRLRGICRGKKEQLRQVFMRFVQREEKVEKAENSKDEMFGMRGFSCLRQGQTFISKSVCGSAGEGVLQPELQGYLLPAFSKRKMRSKVGRAQQEICFRKNENKKPDVQRGKQEKNGGHIEENKTQAKISRWEWKANTYSTKKIMGKIREWVGAGISCFDWRRDRVSNKLQDRHSESKHNDWRGGRWIFSLFKRKEIARREEKFKTERVGVESVESVELGSHGKHGWSYVYDIEVEGNHNYFANGILVHNCHFGISESYKKIYKYYEDKVIIGLTGSPARADQRGLGEIFDDIVETAGIKELTDMGFLTSARYYAPSTVDMKGVKIKCGDYDKTESDKRFNNKKIIGDVLENWLAKAEGRKTIVFSTSVKHSIAIKEAFLSAGVSAEHLDANSTDEERQEVLYNFRHGELKVVTNCQLFTEGYDADFVGCIVLARATKSFPLYVQMVGRGQRIFPGKEDFFVFDHGGNIDRHGFISDPVTWTLDGKELAWKKPKKAEKEKKPVTCSACKLIFQGSKCPDCGTEVKSYGKDVETIDADLEEIKPGKKATVADKRVFLGMLKHWVPRQKNPNPRRIKGIFRGKFGVWPHHSYEDVAPIEPDIKFLNQMKADQIRYAKRKQKELEAQK